MTEAIRVLLVDDQPLFRRAIAALLDAEEGFAVVGQADNGLAGLERAHELRPDLVVMDVEMPVMNGVEAVRLVREQLPQVKVVMLTVSEEDDFLIEAIRHGAHGYLLKNLHPHELFATLRGVLRDEAPVAPELAGRLLAELRSGVSAPAAPVEQAPALSRRELEILRLVAEGLTNKEIGSRLFITEGTVKNHVHNALQKLGLENRIQAAAYVVRHGLGLGAGRR